MTLDRKLLNKVPIKKIIKLPICNAQ